MSILDVFEKIGNFEKRIQVCFFPKNYGRSPSAREDRSQIMKLGNVTYRHIDHWTYKKEVSRVIPCVDKKGEPYLYIQLQEVDE